MTPDTITQLNQLNQDFYQKVAPNFDDSRQYYWEGWEKLVPHIHHLLRKEPLKVLDLGAGNNRFLGFLAEKFPTQEFEYLAVDSNEYLQNKGWEKSIVNTTSGQLKIDIIDYLSHDRLTEKVSDTGFGNQFDLIVSFGFLHHIPSFQLRQKFVNQLLQLSTKNNPQSIIILTAWQFAEDEQQQKKIVDPATVGIDPKALEPNDFILSWNRGVTAYRYCHHVDEDEVKKLQLLNQNFTFSSFYADGKSNQLNRYLVWQKNQV